MPAAPVAFVLKGYPRLSETFIAQEIRALEQRGLDIRLVALRHPTDRAIHPIHREVRAPVLYLPEYLHDEPRRVRTAWWAARRLPGYGAALRAWRADLIRDPSRSRIRRFGQALVLAHELDPRIRWLHAHFLHTPASVTRYAALLRDLPWSVSAHAKDIWTIPDWEKRRKLAECRWLVTCTAAGRDHLEALAPTPGRVALVYHGLDGERFPPFPRARPQCDGSDPDAPVILLSVGRVVPKKGYLDLLAALALLPPELHWRLIHIGGGALLGELQRRAAAIGLAPRIAWRGAQPQDQVLAAYREADLFVLASRIAADGDRDGLPNVLVEAQSQRLACVATRVSGVPELISDGSAEAGATGRLVPPEEPPALARALAELIRDPDRRSRLGIAGERRVRSHFTLAAGIDRLAEKFGLSPLPRSPAETGAAQCASLSMRR